MAHGSCVTRKNCAVLVWLNGTKVTTFVSRALIMPSTLDQLPPTTVLRDCNWY